MFSIGYTQHRNFEVKKNCSTTNAKLSGTIKKGDLISLKALKNRLADSQRDNYDRSFFLVM